ncbi:hypothetical protein HMPREF1583_01356 [Gardnerella vaginalis JCP8151B]|nr:hypothetical protein HMPREF1583_01356 [Gardnerella vaginalis JCP8151B]
MSSNKLSAFCTIFGLKHVQKAEPIDALCTIFNPNHVQKSPLTSRRQEAFQQEALD